jgi:hypothetical protein
MGKAPRLPEEIQVADAVRLENDDRAAVGAGLG